MRILVFAHPLRAGGGRVTCMNTLAALKRIDGDNDYFVIVPDQKEYHDLQLEGNRWHIHYYRRRFSHVGRWLFDRFMMPRFAKEFRPDLVWGMANLALANPPCPQAITIQNPNLFYDVRHTGTRTMVDRLWLFFLLRAFKRTLRATDLVLCQTATMEKRLKEIYAYRGKTAVITKVVSSFSARAGTGPKTRTALDGCAGKFKLFYLTRYYPHKGIEMLVDVMDIFRDDLEDVVAIITIDESQHKNAARLLRSIKSRQLDDRIINAGPLSQEQLADYYNSSDCLVMPTRLESFSGTYLESMFFGLPILTSDLDFAREVCGEAALYFNPWNAASIKDAILKLKNDPELRQRLIEKGQARLASQFGVTWDDIAEELKDQFETLKNRRIAKTCEPAREDKYAKDSGWHARHD